MPSIAAKKKVDKTKKASKNTIEVSSKKPVKKNLEKGIKKTAKKEENIEEKYLTAEEPAIEENEKKELSQAEIYDEMIGHKLDREIIRSQRKMTAGKDQKYKRTEAEKVTIKKEGVIEIPDIISVKEFSEKTGIGAAKVIGELMKNGILANINQQIDYDTAQIIADDLGVKVSKRLTEGSAEDVFKGNLEALLKEEDSGNLIARPPIVVVMGHVDHGKTTLLDHIRETNVVAGESGGITQHIAAYQVVKNDRKITFLDTPGHEAFTAMRARGAKVTDIAILVVAADEGVKPQTVEAIQHAKEANVPIIVAINKIDKDGAQPDKVKGELGEFDLIPEEWGGKTPMVHVSAKSGQGVPDLLEMILLIADLQDLKANPSRPAIGTVIEAHLDKSLGPVATVVVNSGTLHLMDNLVIGDTFGRVKTMKDHSGKNIKNATPSTPVFIAGITKTPQSGDIFQVVADEKTARTKALNVKILKDAERLAGRGVSEIMSQISAGDLKQLKLVLKADTKGSLEALKQSIANIKHEDVGVKVILSGVGDVTESDVMMAAAGQGIVMAFHAGVNAQVRKTAERENVEVLHYTVIYKLMDDIKKILTGLLEPEIVETIVGKAEIKKIFMTKRKEMIIGCKVISGKIEKVKVRVFRNENEVGEGKIDTLKIVDEKVNEVPEGKDCGILYTGFLPLQEGDILEAYKLEKRVRTL